MPLGRKKAVSAIGGLAVIALGLSVAHAATSAGASQPPPSPAPDAVVKGLADSLGISTEQARARIAQQDDAHRVLASLPAPLRGRLAGKWFDARTGKLTVAVASVADASQARAAGADAKVVARSADELGGLHRWVGKLAGRHVPGLSSFGIDDAANVVQVSVDPKIKSPATTRFLQRVRALGDGVQVRVVNHLPVQQAGEVNPGDPWWPGGESNCSVGFPAADAQGGKHFVTAGHCTNDASQAAYGQSGQQNRLGTSNVGGSRSVNAEEGDMGVVAVTEAGWTISAAVNTWGQPAVTVTGSAEAIVGDAVCHSGNTAPNWECGQVTKINEDVDYGHIVKGLTITTACSQGGDSGGAWLRSDKAVGLHSGAVNGNSCPAGDNAIFQPVNEALTKWGLTLYTGGGDPDPDDDEAPTTPGNVRSTGATANSVTLAWDASVDNVGVTGYDVLNGSAVATTVTGTTATVSGLTPDTAYSFSVQAKDAAGNKSKASTALSVRTGPGGGGERTFRNDTDYPIRDFEVTISAVQSSASGAAGRPVTVKVDATHTCTEDLNIRVVSPTGRSYWLQTSGGYVCHPFQTGKTFSFNPVTGEPANGAWTLRIGDNGPNDTGTLSSWSITV